MLFPEGAAGRLLVGAARGQRRPGAPGRARGDRARRDDRPGPVGRRVPAPGTSTASTWPPAGRRPRAGAARSPAGGPEALAPSLVPVRRALHQRARPARCAGSSRRRGSGRRWSRSARSPPGWRTRSTTRRRPPPAPSTRSARPPRPCSARCATLAERRDHRRAVRRARRTSGAAHAARGRLDAARGRRPRGGADRLARRSRRRPGLESSPRRSRPPGPTSPGASGVGAGARTASRSARVWSGSASSLPRQQRCSPRSRSRRGGSPTSSRRCVVLPARPGLGAGHRRHRGDREHPGDARRTSCARRSPSCATTPPTCRGSRPSPASSTRSGRTSSTTPSTPWTARAR